MGKEGAKVSLSCLLSPTLACVEYDGRKNFGHGGKQVGTNC